MLFNISVLLDVKANLPETSPFFVCSNGFGEHLFSNVHSTWDVYFGTSAHSPMTIKKHVFLRKKCADIIVKFTVTT